MNVNEISMKVFIQLPSFILLQLRCFRSRRDVGIMSYRMTLVEPELHRISLGRNVDVYQIRTFP
jgi:hypothetical protein